MQFANGRLTTVAKGRMPALNKARESERRFARVTGQSEFAFIQAATARPMAGPESSWMKCEPGTVTSVWKQSRGREGRLDCFVASAPRNDAALIRSTPC
jgi:hypothetical protein